eukprot:m.50792 g.50792  ORF g.50792 m.50792 type:complete len:213 (-) comp6253_c0_seq1:244-882(-)
MASDKMVAPSGFDCSPFPPHPVTVPRVDIEDVINRLLIVWTPAKVAYVPVRERRATIALFRGLALGEVGDVPAMKKYESEIPPGPSKTYMPRDFRRAVRDLLINCCAAVLKSPEQVARISWSPAELKLTPRPVPCDKDPRICNIQGVDDATYYGLMERLRSVRGVHMIFEDRTAIHVIATLSKEKLVQAAEIPDNISPYVSVKVSAVHVVLD